MTEITSLHFKLVFIKIILQLTNGSLNYMKKISFHLKIMQAKAKPNPFFIHHKSILVVRVWMPFWLGICFPQEVKNLLNYNTSLAGYLFRYLDYGLAVSLVSIFHHCLRKITWKIRTHLNFPFHTRATHHTRPTENAVTLIWSVHKWVRIEIIIG